MKSNLASLDLSPQTAMAFVPPEVAPVNAEQLLGVISSLVEIDRLRTERILQLLEKARLWLDTSG